jgi:hypothetical protein
LLGKPLEVPKDYPVDYFTREEKKFSTEAEAMRAAEAFRLVESST